MKKEKATIYMSYLSLVQIPEGGKFVLVQNHGVLLSKK